MRRPGLEHDIVDSVVYERTVGRFREAGIAMASPPPQVVLQVPTAANKD